MTSNPLDLDGPSFLVLYAAVMVIVVLVCTYLRTRLGGNNATQAALGPLDLAYLAAGRTRLYQTALVVLLSADAVTVSADGKTFTQTGRATRLPADLRPLLPTLEHSFTRAAFNRAAAKLTAATRARLQHGGLVPTDADCATYRLQVLGLFALAAAFGLAKVSVGIDRDKPIGFLLVMLGTLAIFAIPLLMTPLRTPAGSQTLAASRSDNARAARAPLKAEMPLAVALVGIAALAGSEWDGFYQHLRRNGGDSGSTGCSSGGDGGGDGGSGCGGCSS